MEMEREMEREGEREREAERERERERLEHTPVLPVWKRDGTLEGEKSPAVQGPL